MVQGTSEVIVYPIVVKAAPRLANLYKLCLMHYKIWHIILFVYAHYNCVG